MVFLLFVMEKFRGKSLSLVLHIRKSFNKGWFLRSFIDVYFIIISVRKIHWDFCLSVSLNKLLSSFFQKCFLSYSTFIASLVFFVVVLKTRNVHCRQSLLMFIPELTRKCNSHFLGWHFIIFSQGTFYSLIPGHHCGCLSHHFCQHFYSVASIPCALWGRSKDHSLSFTVVPPLTLKSEK